MGQAEKEHVIERGIEITSVHYLERVFENLAEEGTSMRFTFNDVQFWRHNRQWHFSYIEEHTLCTEKINFDEFIEQINRRKNNNDIWSIVVATEVNNEKELEDLFNLLDSEYQSDPFKYVGNKYKEFQKYGDGYLFLDNVSGRIEHKSISTFKEFLCEF